MLDPACSETGCASDDDAEVYREEELSLSSPESSFCLFFL